MHGRKVQNVKTFKKIIILRIVHSYIIFCVCIAPVQVHNWAKYEGSKLNHAVRRATWRIELKWLPFKKYRLYSLTNSCAYTRGICAHMCKIWGLSTDDTNDDDNNANDDTRRTIHDCIGSLAWLPNEPIITMKWQIIFVLQSLKTYLKWKDLKRSIHQLYQLYITWFNTLLPLLSLMISLSLN